MDETVTLTCEASKPNVEATWLKDGKPFSFKDKKKYKVSVDGTTHTLVIPKSEVEDSAEFTCTIGGAKTQGNVTVKGKIMSRIDNMYLMYINDINSMASSNCISERPNSRYSYMCI